MCGRYDNLIAREACRLLFRAKRLPQPNFPPRYNIAPTDPIPIVRVDPRDGTRELVMARWGLVPWWAKEMPRAAMFNARSETADTSGAFKDAFASTRCFPADGGEDSWHIFLPGHQAFSFAGLWASNRKLDITSCTIITQAAGANAQV